MRTHFTFFTAPDLDAVAAFASHCQALPGISRLNRTGAPHPGFIDPPQWAGVHEVIDGDVPQFDAADRQIAGPWLEFEADANVVIGGPERGIRLFSLPRRRQGLSPQEYKRHWGGRHAQLVLDNAGFRKHANRYVQHHVDCETIRAIGDRVPYDGVAEFWFDSIEGAMTAWSGDGYMAELRADELKIACNPPSHRMLIEHRSNAIERQSA